MFRASVQGSVPDKQGVSGQKPNRVTYMTQQTDRKLVMIWWKLWELTCWNLVLTPRLENISETLVQGLGLVLSVRASAQG